VLCRASDASHTDDGKRGDLTKMRDHSDHADRVGTPHRGHLDYLDGWRALAIIAVLIGHFFPVEPINAARFGVELFFALSGRLMAGILFVERYPFGRFFKRRITRVWPALWVFALVCAVAFSAPGKLHVGLLDVVSSLTFTANYFSAHFGLAKPLEHLWSLAVEEWAYVVLAGIAALHRKGVRPVAVMITISVIGICDGAWRTHNGGTEHLVYWLTEVRISSILLPACAFLLLNGKTISSWVPIASGIGGVLLNLHFVPDPLKYSLGTTCLAISMATIDHAPAMLLRAMSARLLRVVGVLSFSLYLWQQPLYSLIPEAQAWTGLAARPLLVIAAFVLAVASYRLIEQPARRWLNTHWAR